MIYTAQTKLAIKLMFGAHKEQLDKSGLPYVFHPFHVAEQMTDELTCTAALLHDVIEDTPLTEEDLIAAGISPEAVRVVALLTHRDNESYDDYLDRVMQDPAARAVKLADLKHNSDLSRLDCVTQKDILRAEKYARAVKKLEEQGRDNESCRKLEGL